LQLFVGFGVSAFAHAGAPLLIFCAPVNDGSVAFFMGQAAIIMLEDHVVDLGKKLGLRDSMQWRCVGLVWTVFAVGASFQRWSSTSVGHGMWIHDRRSDWFGIGPSVVA